MRDRFVIINANSKAYQKSPKRLKSRILDEFKILPMNRQYLASLLRN